MNRGSDRGFDTAGDAHGASMRPRFMNRGSWGGSSLRIKGFGPSFNEAPIHESGK